MKIVNTVICRDKHGRPNFDDWFNAPEIVQDRIDKGMHVTGGPLTKEDWAYINEMRVKS